LQESNEEYRYTTTRKESHLFEAEARKEDKKKEGKSEGYNHA